MITHEIQLRVRYAETDKMGYVYYGNYATYYEVGRVETFRHIGFSYKEMEDAGILMPVLEYKTKFIKPAFYDDLLTIKIKIQQKPGVRIIFEYETYKEDGTLINIGETTLVFINAATGKPCYPPDFVVKLMEPYF